MIQAEKKMEGVNAALAASFEVLKIPMPITSPITIIVRGNKPSLFFSLIGLKIGKKHSSLAPYDDTGNYIHTCAKNSRGCHEAYNYHCEIKWPGLFFNHTLKTGKTF